MSFESFNPQKLKGLNNSQVYTAAMILDAGGFISSLMWLINQKIEDVKFYIFLSLIVLFLVFILPFGLYKFLFGVEKEITKREEVKESKDLGKKIADKLIKKYLEEQIK